MKHPLAKLDSIATGAMLLAGAWLAASPLLVGYTRLQGPAGTTPWPA
jgi:hypothetical protein